jgi:cyclic pyranopterin phosphate synthase
MRFIEFMPMDGPGRWTEAQVVTVEEIRGRIEAQFELTPMIAGESPGDEYLVTDFGSRLSLIGAVSKPFCHRCNRLRVTADGFLRGCLFSAEEHDLRPALAQENRKQALIELLVEAVSGKPHSHCIGREGFVRPTRSMFSTGG